MSKTGSAAARPNAASSFSVLKHLAALDGLRGIAVLLVIISQTPFIIELPATKLVQDLAQKVSLGHFGVDLFFVLSGFLITRILLNDIDNHGQINFWSFYIRRMLRIFPAYLISLAVYVAFFEPRGLLSLLTYTFNMYHPFNPGPHPLENTWSLSVEEQFYLVWPFLIAAIPRASGWRVTALIVPGTAILIAIAIAMLIEGNLGANLIYRLTPVRMMSLSLGAALAFREAAGRPVHESVSWLLMLTGAFILASASLLRSHGIIDATGFFQVMVTGGFSLVSTGVVAFVVSPSSAPGLRIQSWLTAGWLRYVGKISYGLYIYRSLILFMLGIPGHQSLVHGAPAYLVAAFLLLSFGLAALSFHLIEAPILRLKSRLTTMGAAKPPVFLLRSRLSPRAAEALSRHPRLLHFSGLCRAKAKYTVQNTAKFKLFLIKYP